MEILDGPATEIAIRDMLADAKQARIAVSYWGNDAVKRLGVANLKGRDVIVVCDVLSGGCNVVEVKALQRTLGISRVLTLDRLHAKVWLTDKGAIVGSSNASANGLGFEGAEARSLIEANVLIREPSILARLRSWFDANVAIEAREISLTDLMRGAAQHTIARRNRVTYGETLLEAASNRTEDLLDRNIFVWIWDHEEHESWVKRALEEEQKRRSNSRIECWSEVERYFPDGAYVIEFDSAGGIPKLEEIYRVLLEDSFVETGNGTMLLCVPIKNVGGWKIESRRSWQAAAARAVKSKGKKEIWKLEQDSFRRNHSLS